MATLRPEGREELLQELLLAAFPVFAPKPATSFSLSVSPSRACISSAVVVDITSYNDLIYLSCLNLFSGITHKRPQRSPILINYSLLTTLLKQ